MIKEVLKNLKNYKKITITLLLTIMVCEIVITLIAVSYKNAYKSFIKENDGLNKTAIELKFEPGLKDANYIFSVLNKIEADIHIRLICNVDVEAMMGKPKVYFELYKGNVDTVPLPIIRGENFQDGDIKNNNNVVLVGKRLVDEIIDINKVNKLDKININNREYEIKGILGRDKYKTELDDSAVVLMNTINVDSINSISQYGEISIILNGNGNEVEVGTDIKKRIKSYDKNALVELKEMEKNKNVLLYVFGDDKYFEVLLTMTYILAIILCIYIVNYWVKTMEPKLCIRIAFGSSIKNTIKFVLLNIILISIVGAILAVGVIFTIKGLLYKYDNATFGLYLDNIVIVFLLSLINSTVIVGFNIFKIIKINPSININKR